MRIKCMTCWFLASVPFFWVAWDLLGLSGFQKAWGYIPLLIASCLFARPVVEFLDRASDYEIEARRLEWERDNRQ